jgi:cytochrome P450
MPEPLGDQYDPLDKHLDDPFPFYSQAQREMPVFYSSKLGLWMVTRLADVKEVLRDGQTFSSANALRPLKPLSMDVLPILFGGYPLVPVFLVMDGEQHTQRRHPFAAGFGPDRAEGVRHYLTRHATALADDLVAGRNTAEFMAAYANPLAISVICHMMGYAPEHHHALGEDTRKAATLAMGYVFLSDDEQVEAAESWVRSQQLIGRYVAERRAKPCDDLISEVVAAYAPGDEPLSEDAEAEVVGSILGVTLAGHITSAALMGAGLIQLLEHPEQWRLLCERPDLIPNAIEEIARFCAPTHIFLRQTTRNTVLAGQELPAEAEVAICPAAANRDEAAFDRPGEFDITREQATGHMTFGHGPHFCIGATLARLELEISLRILTERVPKLRLVPGQAPTWRPSLVQRGPSIVPVTW